MAAHPPLKKKYLQKRDFTGGAYRTRTGNSFGPTPKRPKNRQGHGPRRRHGK